MTCPDNTTARRRRNEWRLLFCVMYGNTLLFFRINIHPPRATAYDVQHVPAATGSRIENHCGRGRPRTLPLQYATNKYLPAGKTTELIDKALRHNETAVSKFICKKVWIMFVLNKFYYYICKGKEGKPSGRAERGADQTKKHMTSSLYIIISLILVVLRR